MSIQGPAFSPRYLPELIPAGPTTHAPSPGPATSPRPKVEDAAEPASLWSLLTEEERAFFQQQAALGALSYGRGQGTAPSTGAPTGQRLDVRA